MKGWSRTGLFTEDIAEAIDLDKIAASGQCFRWRKTGDGAYAIPAFGRVLHIARDSLGRLEADCARDEWEKLWRPYFDADTDYAAIRGEIARDDAYLLAAAEAGRGIVILRQEPFETLISFIVSQNNNIPRIRRILAALCADEDKKAEGDIIPCFPTPAGIAALGEEGLLRMGMGYRAEYVLEAARRYERAPFWADRDEPTADVLRRLTEYKGVGPKVAACVALFGLGRKDAFPVDVWVRRILDARYRGRFPMERYARNLGVYQQYMFYYERLLSGV